MPLLEALRLVNSDRLAAELLAADVARSHLRHLGHVEAAAAAHCADALTIVLQHGSDSRASSTAADWAAGLSGTCQVGRLVWRPGGLPSHMLK